MEQNIIVWNETKIPCEFYRMILHAFIP